MCVQNCSHTFSWLKNNFLKQTAASSWQFCILTEVAIDQKQWLIFLFSSQRERATEEYIWCHQCCQEDCRGRIKNGQAGPHHCWQCKSLMKACFEQGNYIYHSVNWEHPLSYSTLHSCCKVVLENQWMCSRSLDIVILLLGDKSTNVTNSTPCSSSVNYISISCAVIIVLVSTLHQKLNWPFPSHCFFCVTWCNSEVEFLISQMHNSACFIKEVTLLYATGGWKANLS